MQVVHLPARRKLMRQLGARLTRQRSGRSARRHAGRAELSARKTCGFPASGSPTVSRCCIGLLVEVGLVQGDFQCVYLVAGLTARSAAQSQKCLRAR